MKNIALIILFSSTTLLAQQNLKGSKIIGLSGAGGYGSMQGLVGSLQLETGYFFTNRFYLGADFSHHRKDLSREAKRINDRYNGTNLLEPTLLINRTVEAGLTTRYFLTTGKVKLYTGLGAGLYHYFPAKTENSFAQKTTLPYIKATLGIMHFFGKKEQFLFNTNLDLIQYGKRKNNIGQKYKTPLSGRLNIGLGLRF